MERRKVALEEEEGEGRGREKETAKMGEDRRNPLVMRGLGVDLGYRAVMVLHR